VTAHRGERAAEWRGGAAAGGDGVVKLSICESETYQTPDPYKKTIAHTRWPHACSFLYNIILLVI
jgi:hypothetical protein